MRFLTALLALVLVPFLSSTLPAQAIVTPDVDTWVGGEFTMPILLAPMDRDPSLYQTLQSFSHSYGYDPGVIQVVSVEPGDGLVAFLNDTGPPEYCDIIIYPTQVLVNLDLYSPFEVSIYGSELFRVNCEVVTTEEEDTQVVLTDLERTTLLAPSDIATVVVKAEELPFLRGDLDSSGTCNLTDALLLLGLVASNPDPIPCWDAADVDDSGTITVADAIELLGALFGYGPPLDDGCVLDITEDSLPECSVTGC